MYLNKKAKIIADYLKDSRNKQAVLIDGAWGVGKTFFVNNILMNELNTEFRFFRYAKFLQ